MADLSWLNPTPHAIAVYASQPLSPVVTQHSLPSGRYPLLGPDFHRLDRTSFVLAHLFDHLVGAREQRGRDVEPERLGGLDVDHELELGRLLDRDVGWLRSAQNLVDKLGGPSVELRPVWSIGDQTSGFDILANAVHRGQSRGQRQHTDAKAVGIHERIDG